MRTETSEAERPRNPTQVGKLHSNMEGETAKLLPECKPKFGRVLDPRR